VVDTVDDCPPIVAMARLDASSDLIHLLVVASSPLLARDALTASWEVLSKAVCLRRHITPLPSESVNPQ